MNDFVFLKDLALVMTTAGVAVLLTQLLGQPKAVGYILGGLALGGLGLFPPLISNHNSIQTIGDLGLIFLMFSMGIDFNLRKLRNVGISALVTALIDVAVMISLGFGIGRLLGWNAIESIFLGAIICDSSTTIVVKVLGDLGLMKERFAHVILGATIVEDMLAIVLIALLTGVGMSGSLEPNILFGRIGGLLVFLVILIIVGLLVVPRLLDSLNRFRDEEMLAIVVIGLCFAVTFLSITLDFSLALGAFIIGTIMAEARQKARIGNLIGPLRDIFGAVFFVAIGLMANTREIIQHPGVLMVLVAAVLIGKFFATSTGSFLSGNDRPTSVRVGCGMAQVNEFALIIAALGVKMSATRDTVYSLAVGVSLVTTFISPYLIKNALFIDRLVERLTPVRLRRAMVSYTVRARKRDEGWEKDAVIRNTIRRCVVIILINLAWIAGIFLAGAYAAGRFGGFLSRVPDFLGGANALFWFGAALVTVPFVVASLRKLQALAMILAEMRFPQDDNRPNNAVPRRITEWTITIAGTLGMTLFVFVLSSIILPSRIILAIMAIIVIAIAAISWEFNIRIYSKAQIALREVFAGGESWLNIFSQKNAQSIVNEAHMSDIMIVAGSRAAGKVIHDLNLRALTGATIIGLEQKDKMLVNPAPDEVLSAGDRVYLLGTASQLEKARELLREQAG